MKIESVKENYKKNYTTANGTFYVHGLVFEGDKTVHELHAKKDTCKYKPGEDVDAEFSKIGINNRVKIKAPNAFNGGGGSPQTVTVSSKASTWTAIFQGICTLKANSKDVTLVKVVEETDKLFEKVSVL